MLPLITGSLFTTDYIFFYLYVEEVIGIGNFFYTLLCSLVQRSLQKTEWQTLTTKSV